MMKRKREWAQQERDPETTDTLRPPKRKRNVPGRKTVVHEPATSEEVHTARQLRKLLTFDQDIPTVRHGLQSFKDLLDGIINEPNDSAEKLRVVTGFLEIIKPKEVEDEVPVYLPDIMETWSFASQKGNENVMSAVAVILALLLKVISNHVDLVPMGIGIGRTILQARQLELLAKNLSSDKGKDFIISPTLRLVREIICLDGGALAIPAFRARSHTYKSLSRNMGLRFLGDGIEDPKRPSVRTNAIRVLLSSLKSLHVEGKRDLLFQKDIVVSLMRGLKDDPPYLIFEILNTLRTSVVLDQKLPKHVKAKLLNQQSLIRIASLYSYDHDQSTDEGESVQDAAHNFLLAACTDSSAGVLRPQNGYYPEGVDPEVVFNSQLDDPEDFGLESISWMNQFTEDVPVKNTVLSEFIQTLRPWSSTKQNELVIAIFTACPELIANYFAIKKSFSFDPKLSATWIGYATLLFNTIKLEIPQYLGHPKKFARIPPPTAITLGNIIPLPLETRSMSRCLTQNSKLVSFFAIRLLVIALEKLKKTLELHREASNPSDTLWKTASRRLIDEFCQRTPGLKEIINAYRSLSDDDLLQRVAASRLLLLYHEVIPQVALPAKFDFSPMLSAAIKRFETVGQSAEDLSMRLMELENLFTMAKFSPSMRWFAQGKESSYSPFITLLKLHVANETPAEGLINVLNFVVEEHELVERQSKESGLKPLISALKTCENTDAANWTFLANCAERCARSPIKYQEMILELTQEALSSSTSNDKDLVLSPLVMAMVEQLPYFVSSATAKEILVGLARLLSEYLGYLRTAGVNEQLLTAVLQKLVTGFGDSKARKRLSIADKQVLRQEMDVDDSAQSVARPSSETYSISQDQLDQMLSYPMQKSKDNNALLKWTSQTIEELVQEGYASAVVWLLASEHTSIRKEALTSIAKMAAKIKESSYEENVQVHLLLYELVESSRSHIGKSPMPSTILAFVSHALEVQQDPTHVVYPKLNTFLCSGPVWGVDRIPLVKEILEEPPMEDTGTLNSELSWLLSYLLDGLRTQQDVAIFHKRKVFERLFQVVGTSRAPTSIRTQILQIVYRVTSISGGSDTLITRFGTVALLQVMGAYSDEDDKLCRALVERLWQTCDQTRIGKWSRGFVETLNIRDMGKQC